MRYSFNVQSVIESKKILLYASSQLLLAPFCHFISLKHTIGSPQQPVKYASVSSFFWLYVEYSPTAYTLSQQLLSDLE